MAFSAPSVAATSYYVASNFASLDPGTSHSYAYEYGANEPHDANMIVVLDFGRQVATSSGWEVMLPGTTTTESQSWVQTVVSDFAAGRGSHTPHQHLP